MLRLVASRGAPGEKLQRLQYLIGGDPSRNIASAEAPADGTCVAPVRRVLRVHGRDGAHVFSDPATHLIDRARSGNGRNPRAVAENPFAPGSESERKN